MTGMQLSDARHIKNICLVMNHSVRGSSSLKETNNLGEALPLTYDMLVRILKEFLCGFFLSYFFSLWVALL